MQNFLRGSVKPRYLNFIAGCAVAGMLAVTVPASADDLGEWRQSVVKTIIKSHIYPRSAISREIEGKAKVKVTIDRTGAITGFEIAEESGESTLDEAIPKMMEKMNPLPAPPDSLSDDNLTFVIPITWRLQ